MSETPLPNAPPSDNGADKRETGGDQSGSAAPVSNGLRAVETVEQFLKDDEWHPQRLDDSTTYRVLFGGKFGEFRCYAQVHVDLEQFIFYAVAPVKVPEEQRGAVAEFITRANYGMRIGNFEMDYTDGEVRYKSSLDFEGATLTFNLIRNAIYPAVMTLDRYLPGLMAVTFGGKPPVQAIAEIEGTASAPG